MKLRFTAGPVLGIGTLALLLALGACVTTPRTVLTTADDNSECVVLLHGLNRSWRSMRPMAKALNDAGFTTVNVDYPSQSGSVEHLALLAVDNGLLQCRDSGANRIHFVTHSIGGILLRFAHQQSPIPDLGRVVMLAPPNHGSEMIDQTRDWLGTELIVGEAGLQLGTDVGSVPSQLGPVDFELGVVSGTGTTNPLFSVLLPQPNDGKVSVASTRVTGMDDFLVVDISHRYIMANKVVIENTQSFLQTGAFIDRNEPADHR